MNGWGAFDLIKYEDHVDAECPALYYQMPHIPDHSARKCMLQLVILVSGGDPVLPFPVCRAKLKVRLRKACSNFILRSRLLNAYESCIYVEGR